MSIIDRGLEKRNENIRKIEGENFVEYFDNRINIFDHFTRIIFKYRYKCDENSLLKESFNLEEGIYFVDLIYIILLEIYNMYMYILIFFGLDFFFKSEKERIEVAGYWDKSLLINPTENVALADDVNFQALEFVINNFYIYDFLENDEGDYLIDTRFLNKYEYRKNCDPCGGILRLRLHQNLFVVKSLDMDVKTSNDCYTFWVGLSMLITVCSHAYQVHGINALISIHNKTILPLFHDLRKILLPTEVLTINILARGNMFLVNRSRYGFDHFFPLTFDGLADMVDDYTEKQWNDLKSLCSKFPELVYLNKWNDVINDFADNFVKVLYETEADFNRDSVVEHWTKQVLNKEDVHRQDLSQVISLIYGSEILHSMMSNDYLTYTAVKYGSISRSKCKTNMTYTEYASLIRVLKGTSIEVIPIDRDFSKEIKLSKPELSDIWSVFYKNIHKIGKNFPYLLKSENIHHSTGA